MHFGFALDSWNIDLWDIDLSDTDLNLLVGHGWIQISPVNILFLSKTSSRHLQDMSSRRLQDMSSRHLQDMSSRRLQDVFSVTIFRLPRRLEDVLKTSCVYVIETSWKTKNCYAEDVLKKSWRPTNVCWDVRWIFVEHSHDIFPEYSEKVPYEIPGNFLK